jgi:hypothetical protein
MFAMIGVLLFFGLLWWLFDSAFAVVKRSPPPVAAIEHHVKSHPLLPWARSGPLQTIAPLPKGSPVSMGTPINRKNHT